MSCRSRAAQSALLALLVAGCVTSPPLPPAPILSLAERACTTKPELSSAVPLDLARQKIETRQIDEHAPCWLSDDGSRSSYAVFALPESLQPYQMDVASTPRGLSLFSPKLVLLDAAGTPLRTVTRAQFQFRGGSLHGAARIHRDERYVVVASEPASIGETRQRIQTSTSVTATSVVTVYTGSEAANTFTNAHNGQLSIGLKPLPADALAKP